MKSKPFLLAAAVVVALAAIGGAWSWQRAGAVAAQVDAARPAVPDLTSAHAAFRARLAAAEQRARSRFTARSGLAELAELYHANGFLDEAMRCYAGLELIDPAEPRWPHRHATILAGYGEIEPAMILWQRVVALAPDYLPARLRLGDCELKANQPAKAAATYATVLARDPANTYAQLGLARLEVEAGRWDAARPRLEKLVADTNYTLGYDLIVTLYERTGQHDRALAIRGAAKASGAYRDPPDPWIDGLMDACFDTYRLSLTAGAIARAGDPETGQRLLERALELSPLDVSSHFQLGLLAVERGNFSLARSELVRCTQLAPDFADPWAHLSGLQQRLGDATGAAETLATGLAHCPESPGLHLMRARQLQAAHRSGEAIVEYQTSIRFRPNEPDAYLELGRVYFDLNRIDEGMAQFEQALATDPGEPVALGVLTLHAIQIGDQPAARQWMARVANQPRLRADLVNKLATAYRQQFGRDWQP